jgi:hypothetical protein
MKSLLLCTLVATVLVGLPLQARPQFALASAEDRSEAAQSYLMNQPNRIAIYAKGFVCSSCGIGLRIHLKKVDGVDTTQLENGILMDASKQLLIVALRPNKPPEMSHLRDAIYNAGYDPGHYYRWNGQTVDVYPFPQEAP